jgi:hypothetical protein
MPVLRQHTLYLDPWSEKVPGWAGGGPRRAASSHGSCQGAIGLGGRLSGPSTCLLKRALMRPEVLYK